MYDTHGEEYTFCPKCGALTRNGVCINCGWRSEGDGPDEPAGTADFPNDYGTGRNQGRDNPGTGGADAAGYGAPGGYGPDAYINGAAGREGAWGPYTGQSSERATPPYGPQGYPPYSYRRREGGEKIFAAVVVTASVILLCVFMVLVFFTVKSVVSRAVTTILPQEEQENPFSPGESGPDGGSGQLPDEYGTPRAEEPEEDYVPSPDDDYYVTLADAIRDDLSYSVEWEEYNLRDEETGATAVGRYPQLVGGNIPQRDELNELIKTEATYYSTLYEYYRNWQGDNVVYNAESMGYVTYMDEEKISIVLEESYVMDGQSNISLYSINIDLLSGEVLNNGRLIEYTQQLAEEFRRQNEYQNGTVDAVDRMDDEQLLDFLSDENTNIVFYTPVGLEIGFNYTTSDSSGWVTATIKDYERYVTKF